ncbi:MAG: gas vesicle protein [Methanobacterium sp.]|jgi:hypothetical protein
MEPTRDKNATLVDLLDRILDKGLVIHADLIISVAGIPLIGVNLKAALAGMETMLEYGIMRDWDEATRAWEHRKKKEVSLLEGEEILLKMYGSSYYSKGIYNAWRPGYFYLTNERLILHHKDFDEIIFQISLEEIRALVRHSIKDKKKQVLYLLDKEGRVHWLSAVEVNRLREAIEQQIKTMGFLLEENSVIAEFEDEPIVGLLIGKEKVIHRGKKVWYLEHPSGIQQEIWRPGHLYLTNKRLCWWHDFEKKLVFDVSIDHIINVSSEMRKVSSLDGKKVLDIHYQVNSSKKIASFAGVEIDKWSQVLRGIVLAQKDEKTETCPQCNKRAPIEKLLKEGCSCGWVSPRLMQAIRG